MRCALALDALADPKHSRQCALRSGEPPVGEMGPSGGNEGHVHRAGKRFVMFQVVDDQPQHQCLHGDRPVSWLPVRGHGRERRIVRAPAAIVFTEANNGRRDSMLDWSFAMTLCCKAMKSPGLQSGPPSAFINLLAAFLNGFLHRIGPFGREASGCPSENRLAIFLGGPLEAAREVGRHN